MKISVSLEGSFLDKNSASSTRDREKKSRAIADPALALLGILVIS
jgi:hypothetical protein